MINIKFPDGAVRSFTEGISALEIAKSISEGLAKKVLAASVNGIVVDATRPIELDASLQLLTWTDTDGKNTFWHSSAHLMAKLNPAMPEPITKKSVCCMIKKVNDENARVGNSDAHPTLIKIVPVHR